MIRLYTFAFYAQDGTHVETKAEGEAIDYGDKCVTKCQSVAYREALYKTFVAPFEASIVDPQGSVDIEDQDHNLDHQDKNQKNQPRQQQPARTTPAAPARKQEQPVRKITAYGINANKKLWEDYWIIKMSVKKHEKDANGQLMWNMENMWTHFDDTIHALFAAEKIEDLTIDQSRKLEGVLKQKLEAIIAEETAMRASHDVGASRGFQKVTTNQQTA